jgi:hypothetical protein
MTEHDQQVYNRLRQKMNNRNYKQWEDYKTGFIPIDNDFTKYRIEATKWNEPMLTKMHKTIRLEGKPNTQATKEQLDSGST